MFLYFLNCKAESCGTLIRAVVSPSGGVSNGILIKNCVSTDAYAEDIYITENQAVFIQDCTFTGGTGGIASVYFKNHIDSGLYNCVISSKPGTARAGIYFDTVAYASITENKISDCENGICVKQSNSMPISDNVFENNSASDVLLRSCGKLFITRNSFGSDVKQPITCERKITSATIVGNVFKAAEYDIAAVLNTTAIICKDNTFGK